MDSFNARFSGAKGNEVEDMEENTAIPQETNAAGNSFMASLSGGRRSEMDDIKGAVRETAGEAGAKGELKKKGEGKCVEIWQPGFDARFPNMNKTRRCWQNYVDFFRCVNRYGEEETRCDYYLKTYKLFCPMEWIEKWDEQRENGSFPARLD